MDRNLEMSYELAAKRIEKQFGVGAVMMLGDKKIVPIPYISSGSPKIDTLLGLGGFPRGRVVEIFGPESSGKTTLALQTIASGQKVGLAAIIDAEHALDLTYAEALGVDTNHLIVSQPDYGEQALEIADELIRSNEVSIVVIDSVAALIPKAELEGEMGDNHMGLHARMMSQAMRKLTASIHKSLTCTVFINQIREKIGVIYGSNETTTGGRALKFASSVRLDIRRIASIKKDEKVVGATTKIKIVKNKIGGKPFAETTVDLMFGLGIVREADILDLGVDAGVVDKSGSWLSFKGERLGQGRDQACQLLRENSELYDRIYAEIRGKNISDNRQKKQ